MAETERRAGAVLSVLSGASVGQVADELGVSTQTLLNWVDLFCEGGETRLSEGAPLEPVNRDRFLTLIAHEFRTPLAIIGGWADVLASGVGDSQVHQDALASIRRQVAHLARVARDALDAGAVARGQLRLIVSPLELRQLVRSVITSMRDDAVELAPGPDIELVADGSRLEQVIGGVLEHARRLAGDEPVRVELGSDDRSASVRAVVEGRELDIADAAALLEPYARADTSFGTGLGLYLCRALLVAHGGEIGLRAEAGTTVFWFSLPLEGPEMSRLVQRS